MDGKFNLGLTIKRDVLEQIVIGPDIVVTVVQTYRGGCRLAIQAPRHLKILRGEHIGYSADNPIQSIPVPEMVR